jgi:DNA-binding MarR family transcriptional regulator
MEELPMFDRVRETSRDAFHDHRESGKSAQQRNRILAFIKSRGGDWSIGELAQALTLQKSTVSARVNELLNDTKELVKKTRRKDRISGITIRPVGLPVDGQQELFQ